MLLDVFEVEAFGHITFSNVTNAREARGVNVEVAVGERQVETVVEGVGQADDSLIRKVPVVVIDRRAVVEVREVCTGADADVQVELVRERDVIDDVDHEGPFVKLGCAEVIVGGGVLSDC